MKRVSARAESRRAANFSPIKRAEKPHVIAFKFQPGLKYELGHAAHRLSCEYKTLFSVKKILAVINATYAVAKRKPEKIRLAGIRTLISAIPVKRSNQLS